MLFIFLFDIYPHMETGMAEQAGSGHKKCSSTAVWINNTYNISYN